MNFLDVLWHVCNLLAPALALGLLAASLSKLLWRQALAAVRWRRLAAHAVAASLLALLAGLALSGRDGRMATYIAMVLACALALWWAGFGPGRR
jgi:putative Mn2+ efflux pump MntP